MKEIDDLDEAMTTEVRMKNQEDYCGEGNGVTAIMLAAAAAGAAQSRARVVARGPGASYYVYYGGKAGGQSKRAVASLRRGYERIGHGYIGVNFKGHESTGFMAELWEVITPFTTLHICSADCAVRHLELFVCAAGAVLAVRARARRKRTPRCSLALTSPLPRRQGRACIPVAPTDLVAMTRRLAVVLALAGLRPRATAGISFGYWEVRADLVATDSENDNGGGEKTRRAGPERAQKALIIKIMRSELVDEMARPRMEDVLRTGGPGAMTRMLIGQDHQHGLKITRSKYKAMR